MIYLNILLTVVGWGVGFTSSVLGTTLLERRRAYRALVGELEALRSEFHNYARFDEIHARGVESLKPLVFTAIPFLKGQQQKDARTAWASFRDTKVDQFERFGLASAVAEGMGDPMVTQQRAMDMCLDRLQSFFRIWPL